MTVGDLAFQFLSGLSTGTIFFLIAAGLTLILSVLKIMNFAKGHMVTQSAIGFKLRARVIPC